MENPGQTDKTNFQVKMDAETRDHLYKLLDAAEGTRAEVMERLVPAIEAALSVDVPPSLKEDVESIKRAIAMVESRVGAMAAQYGTIEDAVKDRYQNNVDSLTNTITELRSNLKESRTSYESSIKELEAQIEQARSEAEASSAALDEAAAQLESEKSRAEAQAKESAEWRNLVQGRLDEKAAQIEQMEKAIADKDAQIERLREELASAQAMGASGVGLDGPQS